MGPARSGSSFHVDPNGTCAWNAVLKGRKKWILYPPDQTPPGIDDNGSSFRTKTSLMEWFLEHYDTIKEQPEEDRPMECTCHRLASLSLFLSFFTFSLSSLSPFLYLSLSLSLSLNLSPCLSISVCSPAPSILLVSRGVTTGDLMFVPPSCHPRITLVRPSYQASPGRVT